MEMLLEDEVLGAMGGQDTSGSRVTEIVGEDNSRTEVTMGEGGSRAINTAGEATSRAETVRAL